MTETNSGGIISIPGIKEKDDAIGIPVYSKVKITDARGDIVTRNVEGEICCRGLQVAAGYLNKARETEAAFLPDAGSGPGTGDLSMNRILSILSTASRT